MSEQRVEGGGQRRTLLVRHAELLVTMDDARREISDGGVYAEGNCILQVGPTRDLPERADAVIDARGMVVLPGLINTHHHLYQTLTRALPAVLNAGLFDWLATLYRVWLGLDAEAVYVSALLGMAELLLSGCTTTTDQLYIFPNGASIDDEIRAAQELGMRFQPCRGSMSLGMSQGGLPPDELVQDEDTILADCERLIRRYHDPRPRAMLRISLAPTSPFSVTEELMRQTAEMARRHGVRLHTHVAETLDEEAYTLRRVGRRPVEYMDHLGWLGPDVWFAHAVHLSPAEVARLAATGTSVAHCPTSNMRLGSGIAPVVEMLAAGVAVGLAVDGSASNDSSDMLAEARQALLLQRVARGAQAVGAREVLDMATRQGARALGRDDVGVLAPGMAMDLIGLRLDRLAYAGALHDLAAVPIFCAPQTVDLAVVDGQERVCDGQIVGLDLESLVATHNAISRRLVAGASTGVPGARHRGR
ncbi:MAG: 8-oxoguanine deaminase [Anaerolineae bacterium]|nr:8-oxoguanine deaminase [Anaerolineae bacterium]